MMLRRSMARLTLFSSSFPLKKSESRFVRKPPEMAASVFGRGARRCVHVYVCV
jgi:hypothetical protein